MSDTIQNSTPVEPAYLNLSEIEEYVRARLDELSNGDSSFIADDSITLRGILQKVVAPTVKRIHLEAPNVLLEGKSDRPNVLWNADGYHYFMVPSDFMRLVSVKINTWSRSVVTLINEDSVEYRKQKNRYLRGTNRSPVAAITHTNGSYVLELYGGDNSASLSHFIYLPEPVILSRRIAVCPKLKDSCLDAITAEVLKCYGENQKAQMFENSAMHMLFPTSDADRIYPPNGEKTIE